MVEKSRGIEWPWSGSLRVEAHLMSSHQASWVGSADEQGEADVLLEFGQLAVSGPIKVHIVSGTDGHQLGHGQLSLAVQTWQEQARRRGGWIEQHSPEGLVVRVAPALGILAVPFAGPLWIEVADAQGPVAGARLELVPEEWSSELVTAISAAGVIMPLARVVRMTRETMHVATLTASAAAVETPARPERSSVVAPASMCPQIR